MTVAEASSRGISWRRLQSKAWSRAAIGVYVHSRSPLSPETTLAATLKRLPSDAVFSGRTAAWLHGLDASPCTPIEATVPAGHSVSHRAGIHFHKSQLTPSEITSRRGFPVTTLERTLTDVGSGRDIIQAVVVLDQALAANLVSRQDLNELVVQVAGRKGTARLRRAVDLSAPGVESPMESRLRMVLVMAGLPRPEVQVPLYDKAGQFCGRVDMYYPSHRLCLEYDGRTHKDSLVDDSRRQNRLLAAGYQIYRFASADVWDNPQRVVALVRGLLAVPPAISPEINHRGPRRRTISGEIAPMP